MIGDFLNSFLKNSFSSSDNLLYFSWKELQKISMNLSILFPEESMIWRIFCNDKVSSSLGILSISCSWFLRISFIILSHVLWVIWQKKSSSPTWAADRVLKVWSLDTSGYWLMISALTVSREEFKSLNRLVAIPSTKI